MGRGSDGEEAGKGKRRIAKFMGAGGMHDSWNSASNIRSSPIFAEHFVHRLAAIEQALLASHFLASSPDPRW